MRNRIAMQVITHLLTPHSEAALAHTITKPLAGLPTIYRPWIVQMQALLPCASVSTVNDGYSSNVTLPPAATAASMRAGARAIGIQRSRWNR